MKHETILRRIGTLNTPDPKFGDFKLSVFPFENTGKYISLPDGFKLWEEPFNEILKHIPLSEEANTHYVTIDSKFFPKANLLRREGVHVDGNFCVDPNFRNATWGGVQPTWGGVEPAEEEAKETWGGIKPTWSDMKLKSLTPKSDNSHVKMDWVLPYDIMIPVGDYISKDKGGIFCVSTEVGCQVWDGEFFGEVGAQGDFSEMVNQLSEDKKTILDKNTLYFMTSNTPHETLITDKGMRRTLIRITLNHEYPNAILPCMKEVVEDLTESDAVL